MRVYFKDYDFEDCGFCKNCYVDTENNNTYSCKKDIYINFVDSMPVLQPIPHMHEFHADLYGKLTEEEKKSFENGKCLYYDADYSKDDEED